MSRTAAGLVALCMAVGCRSASDDSPLPAFETCRAAVAARTALSAAEDPDGLSRLARAAALRVEIDRDRAKVYLVVDGKENPDDPVLFVRGKGVWKLDPAEE